MSTNATPANVGSNDGLGRNVETVSKEWCMNMAKAEAASDSAPDSAGFVYCWLVEEFGADGNSTGRYMLDQGSLKVTADVCKARRLRRQQSAEFRALDMKALHKGDWRAVEHGFGA